MNILELRDFAIKKHGDQKYGEHPYVFHLDMVYEVSLSHGLPPVVNRASIGLDLKEDTNVTEQEIVANFGEEEAKLIEAVTDEPGKNRKEKKAATYPKIKANANALAVKLCDRIANVRACRELGNKGLLEMYQREQPEFEAQLKTDGQYTSLWEELDRLIKG